ncbi:hypothetical protein TcCL_ESM08247 [Trypanosoma cruzi]|nr:hypothetical protein TcCL_ESM08247 [Trypanosoma cruzi]
MGTTTASPLEKVPRSVGCGAARRFVCSLTDRTAQSFYCGHSVGITRCGGVRKSRSADEDGLLVVWQLRTSGPSPPQDCSRCSTGAAPARHGSSAGVQARECSSDEVHWLRYPPPGLQWACRWRGLLGAPHLAVRAPVARGTNCLETTAFRVCPPACPSMYVVNLCNLSRQLLTLLTLRAPFVALALQRLFAT